MDEALDVSPGPEPGTVKLANGQVLAVPKDWQLLPPGDAGLTRRVKAAGPSWTVKEKKGRKVFSRGVWAPAIHIQNATAALEKERSTDAYVRRQQSAKVRRDKEQAEYVGQFSDAVYSFLQFHQRHEGLARRLAKAIADHATPVGSGTVARTERIPIEQRAESAVIAWLRHQTTGYDNMKIERVKGQRREVRRRLAARSRELLEKYREGKQPADCLLEAALEKTEKSPPAD